MLLVKQLKNEEVITSDYVRCPCCTKGRLCDKPVGLKVSTEEMKPRLDNTGVFVILKCHKCGRKSTVQFLT